MYDKTYGDNHDSSLSTTDIAKKIRTWITAEKKAGNFPKELKVSVRSSYFAGGSSISASITALPKDMEVFNAEWYKIEAEMGVCFTPYGMNRYSDDVQSIKDRIAAYINSFNYDGSESQVDYFDVNFYFCNVEMDWENYTDAERNFKAMIKETISQ